MRQIVALAVVLSTLALVFGVILQSEDIDPAKAKAWQQLGPKQRRVLVRNNLQKGVLLVDGKREHEQAQSLGNLDMAKEGRPIFWKQLTGVKWQPGTPLPPSAYELHGQYIKLKGYILPIVEADKVTEFLFLPSYWSGYFTDLGVTGFIRARFPDGPMNFTDSQLILSGRLSVGLETIDGEPSSIYQMEVTLVERVDPFKP